MSRYPQFPPPSKTCVCLPRSYVLHLCASSLLRPPAVFNPKCLLLALSLVLTLPVCH